MQPGDWYSEKRFAKGLDQGARGLRGGGYFEFTAIPTLSFAGSGRRFPDPRRRPAEPPVVVDVTMRIDRKGEQYFVNRITFTGNTTTRDNVIRRELRLVESGVFNTEALKHSVRGSISSATSSRSRSADSHGRRQDPQHRNKVDVTLKLEEQNRNQLTFGAGVSQFEGFFGQLSFQTANFMGRGETSPCRHRSVRRAKLYQLAFTEPFLFDRAITGGFDLFKRRSATRSTSSRRSPPAATW
jgi:outer membrane protein insertion porin family